MGMLGVHRVSGLARSVAVALLVVFPTASASAQVEAPDKITVTGVRLSPGEAKRQAEQFVRQAGVAPGYRAAARWADPICPRTAGVGPDQVRWVEERIRAVATAAGARVAPANCRPNVAVHFTRDAGSLVRRIAVRSPGRLTEVPAAARRALEDGAAPIRWWYTTAARGKDGVPVASVTPPWIGIVGASKGAGSLPTGNARGSTYSHSSSMISTGGQRTLHAATIIIDVDRARGRPIDAIASYVAMVAMAELSVGTPPPVGSILDLFGEAGAMRDLTGWDTAFLRALYRLPHDRKARYHRGRLVRDLAAARTGR